MSSNHSEAEDYGAEHEDSPVGHSPTPPSDTNALHTFSDVDNHPNAQHHTLGLATNQAAPGDHTHGSSLALEAFTRTGLLVVEDYQTPLYMDKAQTISLVRASVWVAPTGASIIIDMLKNGATSIWSNPANRPTIIAGNVTATSVPDLGGLAAGDFISPKCIQVGSTYAGLNLVITVEF